MKEKVVIITGAGSGIGAAAAEHFAGKGAKVVVSDVNEQDAVALVEKINSSGGEAIFVQADVSQHEQVEQLVSKTVDKYGQLDVLVNNAGIGNKTLVKTAERTPEDFNKVIAVNQCGVFYGMKYALQQMMKQGSGNIVNIASIAGMVAMRNNIEYTASKFAVVGMTKSAALEYASKNIRINCVCPGYTHSALLDQLWELDPSLEHKLMKLIPMKRYGESSEIAEAIYWLASDNTKFITGQSIVLDGGLSL